MTLSNDLIQKFVKLTNESNNTPKQETYAYGTVQKSDGSVFVLLDGATTPTPATTTSEVIAGERVMVLIKNHTATIMGNTSSPSARVGTVENIAKEVTEFEVVMADKVVADDILAINAIIENLKATVGSFKDLSTEDLEAINAEIDKLHAKYADLDYVAAKDVDILNAYIETLQVKLGTFENISADELKAANAEIDNLKSINAEFKYVSAENLKVHYANIDFSNIGKAAMEYFYAKSGLIENVIVGDQEITGRLIGVTISGDLIEGNTIKAEKLVVRGENGLYYKLNIEGGSTVTEQISEEDLQNGLDGSNIIAKTITATKISVSDLVAFDATIAGFNITNNALYSGVKETVDNTTRGIYLDKTGQVAFGDASNFLKFYKDTDGTYKLAISASTIMFSNTEKTVEQTINEIEIGGRNLVRDSRLNEDTDLWHYDMNHQIISFDNGYLEARRTGNDGYMSRSFNSQHYSDNPLLLPDEISGETYTLSADFKAIDGVGVSTGGSSLFFRVYYDDTSTYEEITLFFPSGLSSTKWTRAYATKTFSTRNWVDSQISIAMANSNNGICIKNIKLEKSTKPTDWSPAPEDMDEGITNAQESADKAQSTIDNAKTYTHTVLSVDGGATLSYFDFSGHIEPGTLSMSNGSNIESTTNVRSSEYIKVNSGSTYTWNVINSSGAAIIPTTHFYSYDASTDIYAYHSSQTAVDITVPDMTDTYIRFTVGINNDDMTDSTYELTLSDIDSIVASNTIDVYVGTLVTLDSYMSINAPDYEWSLTDTSSLRNATELAEKLNAQLNDETDGELKKLYLGIKAAQTSADEAKAAIDDRQRYVQIKPDEPSISLVTTGDIDNPGTKVRLDSSKVSFHRGATEGAYIGYADSEQPDRTSMAIGKTYVTELFPRVEDPNAAASEKKWIGQLCWVARTNGHLSLKVVK